MNLQVFFVIKLFRGNYAVILPKEIFEEGSNFLAYGHVGRSCLIGFLGYIFVGIRLGFCAS
jgi:hypothetical protein